MRLLLLELSAGLPIFTCSDDGADEEEEPPNIFRVEETQGFYSYVCGVIRCTKLLRLKPLNANDDCSVLRFGEKGKRTWKRNKRQHLSFGTHLSLTLFSFFINKISF